MTVIIAGGGMTGATLALAISHLTQGQLPVTLIENSAPDSRSHPGYDSRAIALAAGTRQQLVDIDLWRSIEKHATAITDIHVSDRGHAGFVTLDAEAYQIPALGYVVELFEVGQRLFDRLKSAPGVTLHCPARVSSAQRQQDNVQVTLESGERLDGALLVAADGSRSPLAASFGIQWQREDYHQLAVIANVSTQLPHQGRAFERFTEHGPLALLPMSDNRLSLVWCHPLSAREKVESWSDSEFLAQLQRAFGWRLGRFTHTGQRESYPLRCRAPGSRFRIGWRWLAMRRRRCIPSPGRVSTSGCATLCRWRKRWRPRIVSSRMWAAMTFCNAINSVASPIATRLSASPTGWCGCSPIAMRRWWRDEIWG